MGKAGMPNEVGRVKLGGPCLEVSPFVACIFVPPF